MHPSPQAPYVDLLASVELFAGLAPRQLADVAARCHLQRFRRAETVVREGDPGASYFLVVSGRLKVTRTAPDGRESIVAMLGVGEGFGELALLGNQPRSANVIALQDVRVLVLDRDTFLALLAEQPPVAIHLLAVLTRKIHRLDRLLQAARHLSVPARVAQTLLHLTEDAGVPDGESVRIPFHLSQSDLAAMAGTSRETLNRCLGQLVDDGLIRWDGRQLIVLRLPELRLRVA